MTIPNYIKKSFLSAVVFGFTLAGIGVGFSALSSGLSTSDKVSNGAVISSSGWNKIVDSILELDTKTSLLNSDNGVGAYSFLGPAAFTSGNQCFGTVMTLPSVGTYLIWINARIDFQAGARSHLFLSSVSSGNPLFGVNYISNDDPNYGMPIDYSNMGVLTVTTSTPIYLCGTNGAGNYNGIGYNQSTAGYLKLK